jgi:PAS domain S-box-containing protein
VLAFGLAATAVITSYATVVSRAKDLARFGSAMDQTISAIQERLNIYVGILQGGAALMAVQEDLTPADFQVYAERLNVRREYPGIQGIGYARRVLAPDLPGFLETLRARVDPRLAITPAGERPEYFPVIFLEPMDARNRPSIGYDMFSEPVRRQAMEQARDTGQRAMSGKVLLMREITEAKQAGLLIYIPVYQGGGVPATVAERRRLLAGFIYSPFRVDDLFQGIFPSQARPAVRFDAYDGAAVLAKSVLHRSPARAGKRGLERTMPVEVAGRPWTIRFETTEAFDTASSRSWSGWVFAAGLLTSLGLYWITDSLARARVQNAAERERYEVTLTSIGDGVISTDPKGRVTFMNPVAEQLTGWSLQNGGGKPLAETFHVLKTETGEPATDPFHKVLAEGQATGAARRMVLRSKEGIDRVIETNAAPIRHPHGVLDGAVIVFHDATAKHQLEQHRRQAHELRPTGRSPSGRFYRRP